MVTLQNSLIKFLATFLEHNQALVSLQSLIDNVKAGNEITFTGVPFGFGSGRRIGIDRDSDGILDGSDNNPTNFRQK